MKYMQKQKIKRYNILKHTMHLDPLESLPVDTTLTKETATKRSYTWLFDFSKRLPDALLAEIFTNVQEEGYKLGCAADSHAGEDIGLYQPIEDTLEILIKQ